MAMAETAALPDERELEEELLQAHQRGDAAGLARLYAEAADRSEAAGRSEEAGYRYTQAYVYALEGGVAELCAELKAKLVAQGREE